MSYPVQTIESADPAARPILERAQKSYGFVPNLMAVMANAPALVEAYATLGGLFDRTSFTPTERQVVLLATSRVNGCSYCMAAHTAIASMQKVPQPVIEALREGGPIPDARLEALRAFTASVVDTRGYPPEAATKAFLAAGYGPQQVLEVILGVGMKTLSNYTNHIAETPLDDAFSGVAWSKA